MGIKRDGRTGLSITDSALRLADSAASMLGLLGKRLHADALLHRAAGETGLSDFGDDNFLEPLRVFLASCSSEAALGLLGEAATRWDVMRFLVNLLRLRDAERRDGRILDTTIEKPIFITGLPRSGTTFLHRMMMADRRNRAPLVWQTIHPYPDLGLRPGARDNRVKRVARGLALFEHLAPEFRALHPLDATSPQECSEINAHVFRSMRFDSNYHIPSYRHWLDADVARHLPAYQFHKRFLQHLQHQAPEQGSQWVLKCPEHVFALRAIRAVYPDARLIFVHRDPVKVLLSVAKLTEVLRKPFSRRVDPKAIGRDESARWLDGTRRMIDAGDAAGFQRPICHVHYIDLVTDPVSTVDHVYKHFEMQLDEPAVAAMGQYVAERPKGGYGPRDYHFEDHGLNAAEERAKFLPYMLRFGISPEALPLPRVGDAARTGRRSEQSLSG
jgi:Sulfotransferase family